MQGNSSVPTVGRVDRSVQDMEDTDEPELIRVCLLVSVQCLWTLRTRYHAWELGPLLWRCVNVHGVTAVLPVRSVLHV